MHRITDGVDRLLMHGRDEGIEGWRAGKEGGTEGKKEEGRERGEGVREVV